MRIPGRRNIFKLFYHSVIDDPSRLYKDFFYPAHRKMADIARRTLLRHRAHRLRVSREKAALKTRPVRIIVKNESLPPRSNEKRYALIVCALGDTIEDVKKKAVSEFDNGWGEDKIWFGTKGALDTSKTVLDYGITNGATIGLVRGGLRSGNPHKQSSNASDYPSLQERVTRNAETRASQERKENLTRKAAARATAREQKKEAKKAIKKRTYNQQRKNESREQAKRRKREENERAYGQSTFLSREEKHECMLQFESELRSIKHNHCSACKKVGINLPMSRKKGTCSTCDKLTPDYWLQQKLLPVWYNDSGQPQYRVPNELSGLTDAEKMLIQKASVFIPLHHIKHGTLGLKGHSCCFPQDLGKLCTVLPRLPTDVTIIKLVQKYRDKMGKGEPNIKTFRVRKERVLCALRWLKAHNPEYKDITIEPRNMDWMNNQTEGDLPTEFETTTNVDREQVSSNNHS